MSQTDVQSDYFPTTHWSLLNRLDGGALSAAHRQQALGELLQRYRPAMRTYLRSRGYGADRAEDLIQSFIVDKVLEKKLLARADRKRGRFRAFLCVSLRRFVNNKHRDEQAACRSPGHGRLVNLNDNLESSSQSRRHTADAFDIAWARELIAEALRRMQADCHAAARANLWAVFNARVVSPCFSGHEPQPYEVLMKDLGYSSYKQIANALVTSKRRFEAALRSVVAEYVTDDSEVEQELSGLANVLASV